MYVRTRRTAESQSQPKKTVSSDEVGKSNHMYIRNRHTETMLKTFRTWRAQIKTPRICILADFSSRHRAIHSQNKFLLLLLYLICILLHECMCVNYINGAALYILCLKNVSSKIWFPNTWANTKTVNALTFRVSQTAGLILSNIIDKNKINCYICRWFHWWRIIDRKIKVFLFCKFAHNFLYLI